MQCFFVALFFKDKGEGFVFMGIDKGHNGIGGQLKLLIQETGFDGCNINAHFFINKYIFYVGHMSINLPIESLQWIAIAPSIILRLKVPNVSQGHG